jgi:hypothetical protein
LILTVSTCIRENIVDFINAYLVFISIDYRNCIYMDATKIDCNIKL